MQMFQTLGRSMAFNETLKVKCACGHEAAFSQKDAMILFGEGATPYDVRRRLRCAVCKMVGKVEVRL